MSFDAILGQEIAVHTLRLALRAGRVHHAYCFEGPAGVGKERAALALAAALVCQTPTAERGACGACSACRRAVTISAEPPNIPQHPDVVFVGAQLYNASLKKREKQGIGVEQIRKVVLERERYGPHEGQALVFIVKDAHQISQEAANALLKTLEEPRPNTYFVLLTDRVGELLPTIRSRSLMVRFRPLPDVAIAEILRQHARDPSLAPLAEGSAERALEVADTEATARREAFADVMRSALSAPDLATAIAGLNLRGREAQELASDLMFVAHQIAARARALAKTDADAAERAASRYSAILESVRALEHHAAPALTVERLVSVLRRLSPPRARR